MINRQEIDEFWILKLCNLRASVSRVWRTALYKPDTAIPEPPKTPKAVMTALWSNIRLKNLRENMPPALPRVGTERTQRGGSF